MSANTISIGGSAVLYDFTTSNTMAYGTNAMKALTGGVFGLYGGDVNRSGIVNNADRSLIISANLQSGYKSEDANLSGIVSAPDRNFATNNNTKGTLVPALTNTPLKVNNIIKTQAGD